MVMTTYGPPSCSTFMCIFKYANEVTGDAFWVLMSFAIFIIAFMVFQKSALRTKGGFAVASFILFLLTHLLAAGELVGELMIRVATSLLLIAVVWVYIDKN